MKHVIVRNNMLHCDGKIYPCAIGKGGLIAAAEKREGDGCTPIGTWRLRECWYRADRLPAPITKLPLRIITPEDKWCDDPTHALYNRHFTSPPAGGGNIPSSYENLWRDDNTYDIIIPLGYNDNPILPGKGSAIFLHCAKENFTPTEGCVALERNDLLKLLPSLGVSMSLTVEA